MEKVVLSKGYEFELIPNAVSTRDNTISITFKPGDKTAEELLAIWEGNDKMSVKIDATDIHVYTNFTRCMGITLTPNYLISTEYVCPECGTLVEPSATTCPSCNAAFESPKMTEIRDTVCTVKCTIPDINDRMSDVEESIGDIINTILG